MSNNQNLNKMKTMNNNYEAPMAEMIELNAQASILEGSNEWINPNPGLDEE